ncbi:ribosomal protein S18-alanine N-acetyltransferase [Carnobacterium inhibens]|uniref:GNAT family acetyltransferase n=1 Tax=Carnobacterium inhibens subsp. gilichinskyi TaxID=1266845 RepID=U5SEA6_9LACT|nr:ribosomal protein S18-alanine N-acetyltransferase [Carnobacterium inhibens]AGY82177.1 GNAT family acetyltransferase [Carnobacterium inhibens subsp. gilichinskyi]
MLKKFKQWFSETTSFSQLPLNKKLAKRARLEKDFVQLSDGSFLTVSIGSESDISGILKIESLCYNGKIPWNEYALQHEIKNNNRAIYLIVRQSTKPVGFIAAWLVEEEAHITNVAVIPNYQKQGIATFMITELQKIALQEGIQKVSLEVRVSNKKAQSLYRTMGFENGKIKENYYSGDREDALEMSKFL